MWRLARVLLGTIAVTVGLVSAGTAFAYPFVQQGPKLVGTGPISYANQWQRCAPACVDIAHARYSTYTLDYADLGARIQVVVMASNIAGATTATSRPTAAVMLSLAQVKEPLVSVLAPHGKAAKLGSVLKAGGYPFSFGAPLAGRLVLSWYYLPKGAHPSAARTAKPAPVLVGSVTATFTRAKTARLKLTLTGKGRRLLRGKKRMTLAAKGTFTPTSQSRVSATRQFTLTR